MKLANIILEDTLHEQENFSALAQAIQKELEGKDIKQDGEANEVVGVLGILSYILLSNTVANLLSSMASKIAKKQGWDKVGDKAKAILSSAGLRQLANLYCA